MAADSRHAPLIGRWPMQCPDSFASMREPVLGSVRCSWTVPCLGAMLAWGFVAGCGSGRTPLPQNPVNNTANAPQPASGPAPSVPASGNAVAKANTAPAGKTATKSNAKPANPHLSNARPDQIFEFSEPEKVGILSRGENLPGNQFAVVDRPRSTSDRFVLASTENPANDPRRPIGSSGGGGTGAATNASTNPAGNNTANGTNAATSLPSGFTAVAGSGTDESGLPTLIRCDVLGAELVLIPSTVGIFGSQTGPEETQPQVRLFQDAFYITQTELTLGQYVIFQRDRDEKKIRVPAASNTGDNPNHPVLGLSWGQAQVFVRWAGMELPTEVEWELAARGPTGYRCPWGDGRALWPDRRTPSTISPVGRYRGDISPYGVYDLAGNAKEWCADWYSPTSWASSKSESSNQGRNWSGPRKAEPANHRVVKGNAPDWSCWGREGREMNKGYPDVGIRGVLRLPSATPRQGT